jgi:H+/Cl- antiporter ClcA
VEARIGGAAYLRLIALGALIGIPAAVVAAGFISLVHVLTRWLWKDLPNALGHDSPPWYFVLFLPVLGALVVLAARRLLPGDGGHDPIEGFNTTPTPVKYVPGVLLAAVATLGFGAVLGPEAPVVALGSAVGMLVTRFAGQHPQATPMLSNAGSFSAISALFGGPIVAGMLLVEGGVGLGTALLPALVPGLVAAAVGYVVFLGLGSWPGLKTPGLIVPDLPDYKGTHLYDLLIAVVVGILAALVAALVRAIAARVHGLRPRLGMAGLLLAGGLVVGGLALLGRALGANSQDILFSGQSSVGVLVESNSTKIVVVLLVTKLLAYAVCLGCGFRGGPIFPALFIGVAVASLAVVWFGTSPTLAMAVGATAGMAAQTRLLFTPLIFGVLLVGGPGLDTVSAAALASAGAWVTTFALDRRAGAEDAGPRAAVKDIAPKAS